MEGAHPKVMERLIETNLNQTQGYGFDEYCDAARNKIRSACGLGNEAPVYFLTGGTQTNATVIGAVLRSHEGVIAAKSGHINGHEAGAIELGGHKVLALNHEDGRLSASAIDSYISDYEGDSSREHIVRPGMVYISHPTEYGTLYTREELLAIRRVCDARGIPLFMDGARLGYGLAADASVDLPFIASVCDVFYIGGTKVGALFGEAVVFPNAALSRDFFTIMKQHGAVMAKGRLLGLQFDALFTDGLYTEIAAHAVALCMKLKRAFIEKGYEMYIDAPANQIFPILSDEAHARLSNIATFGLWERLSDGRSVYRFVTSWATKEKDVDALIAAL